MYYELALISVLIAGGYWGQYFVRQQAFRTFGLMQLGAAALAGIGLIGRKLDVSEAGVAGAIGVGAGMCLLVLGPLTRGLARRIAATERFGLADKLLDVANVLAPGSGVPDEQALLGAMREIRDGNIEQTVDALTAAKDRAPAEARLAIDERIAMLYLTAYRWDEAIAHAEQHLFGALPETSEATVSLRRALGVAPPVWVELLGAYGYKRDLDRAARMLARLEDVCAGRDDAAIWVHRGRMVFLALAGRVAAVETLVEPRRSRHMSRAARTYWIAVAHERRGDGPAARAAYAKARAGSRGRPRALIDQALARLETTDAITLGLDATELVARVEAAPPPAVVTDPRKARGPWATWLVTGLLVAVAAAIALLVGDSSDVGVLIRAGAMVRGLVHDGEWWRLVSCVVVHVGGIHLLVNATGMWFLGRLAEDLFGPARMIAMFAISGVAGAAASYLASPAGVSAGASGAIFGLLGAVFVELTWHRQRHRVAWSRGVWGSLAVVTVAQLGVGFLYPAIDQWAHGAGLAAGAVMGFAMSPNAKWTTIARYVARAIALGAGVLAVVTAVLVIRTSVADSFDREPRVHDAIGDLSVTAPATWRVSADALEDPDLFIVLTLQHQVVDGTAPPVGGADGRKQVPAVDGTAPPVGGADGRKQVPAVDGTAPPVGGADGRKQVPAVDGTAPPVGGADGRKQVPAVDGTAPPVGGADGRKQVPAVDGTAPPVGGADGRKQVPAVDGTAPPVGGADGRKQVPAVDGTAPPVGGADGRKQVPAVDGTAPPVGGADGRKQVPAVDGPLAVELATYAAGEPDRARGYKFDQVDVATDRSVVLPPSWEGSELVVSAGDPLGNRQRYRVVVAGKAVAGGVVLASLYVPETVARAAPAFFTGVLASVTAATE